MEPTYRKPVAVIEADENIRYGTKEKETKASPMELAHISRVFTIPEAAEILRLSPYTVKRLVQRGKIKAAKTGDYGGKWRISERAIEDFLMGSSN